MIGERYRRAADLARRRAEHADTTRLKQKLAPSVAHMLGNKSVLQGFDESFNDELDFNFQWILFEKLRSLGGVVEA
jgi:hypothetical protein